VLVDSLGAQSSDPPILPSLVMEPPKGEKEEASFPTTEARLDSKRPYCPNTQGTRQQMKITAALERETCSRVLGSRRRCAREL
jgi:hypothetical protein